MLICAALLLIRNKTADLGTRITADCTNNLPRAKIYLARI